MDFLCPRGQLSKWVDLCNQSPREWSTPPEFDAVVKSFKEGGFEGPLNWFKASLNHRVSEASIPRSSITITRPVLFLAADNDAIGHPDLMAFSAYMAYKRGVIKDSYIKVLKNTSHWMMLQKPQETFVVLDEFATLVESNQTRVR